MSSISRRSWRTLAALFVLALPGVARAQPVSAMQHTAWTFAQGAPPDIWSIAQTANGYLWLGTGDGLYRFDGVHFVRITPAGAPLLHTDITAMLALPDDTLVIGYQDGGISRLTRRGLVNLAGLPDNTVNRIERTPDGRIVVLAFAPVSDGGVQIFAQGHFHRLTAGLPPTETPDDLAITPDGAIWLLSGGRLYVQRPGQAAFAVAPIDPWPGYGRAGVQMRRGRLAVAPDGSLWIAQPDDIVRRLTAAMPGGRGAGLGQWHAKAGFSREGALWTVLNRRGIVHVAAPDVARPGGVVAPARIDSFGRGDELTSNLGGAVFEDREGDIWVGTNMGLDRFHAADVVAERAIDPTSRFGYRIAVGPGGTLYVLHEPQLDLLRPDGTVTVLSRQRAMSHAICSAAGGGLWVSTSDGFRLWRGRTARAVALPAGVTIDDLASCGEDGAGRLWLVTRLHGVFRRDGRAWRPLPEVPGAGGINSFLLVGDGGKGMWVHIPGQSLEHVVDGTVRRFGPAQGLDIGSIEILSASRDTLVGGELGLAWWDGRRFISLRPAGNSPFRRIAGIVQTATGETWLNTLSGIIAVATADLHRAFRQGRWPERYRLFNRFDGLPGVAQQDSLAQTAFEGTDGRLWFITNQGIAWIDPRRLAHNTLPPPVVIEDIVAGGRRYPAQSGLTLPPGTTNLQIDYTANSLRVPERVAFRTMLDGVDAHWTDPGERRQAFYTRLEPGSYVFRVIAANDAGAWNRTGAQVRFTIRPRFTETALFRVCVVAAAVAVLLCVFAANLRRISARLRDRMEERIRERERIARELHDTLLQGFQGLQLHFQSAVEHLPGASPARRSLESALGLADDALTDARQRVRDLRSSQMRGGLPEHLRRQGERLLAGRDMTLRIVEEGSARDLDPAFEREVAAIAEEAIFNAARHADARAIEVRIGYGWRRFVLTIADNGKGIGPAAHAATRRGHFGLLGMRERARRMHGVCVIEDRPGGGTLVRVSLPGLAAYGMLAWLTGGWHRPG